MLTGVKGGDTILRIYYVRKERAFNKGNNGIKNKIMETEKFKQTVYKQDVSPVSAYVMGRGACLL